MRVPTDDGGRGAGAGGGRGRYSPAQWFPLGNYTVTVEIGAHKVTQPARITRDKAGRSGRPGDDLGPVGKVIESRHTLERLRPVNVVRLGSNRVWRRISIPSEVAFGECAAGAGLQVRLEAECSLFRLEFHDDYRGPRTIPSSVDALAGVVCLNSFWHVSRETDIMTPRVAIAAEHINEPLWKFLHRRRSCTHRSSTKCQGIGRCRRAIAILANSGCPPSPLRGFGGTAFALVCPAEAHASASGRVSEGWRRGWDSNPRAGYPTRRFRGAPVTTTSVPLR